MSAIDIVINHKINPSLRVRQLGALFDVPIKDKMQLKWSGDAAIDKDDWSIGLIVGPSGSGKTTIAEHLFGKMKVLKYKAEAVIDDFPKAESMENIVNACMAVGFNTIPAWMRPYNVLSNGEKFRVDVARRILELKSPIVIDEFTSVVDRNVAKIASHAVQKYIRKSEKKMVAVSCHYDIVDWLQPDWILEPATMKFSRRLLQPKPALNVSIRRVPHEAWNIFSKYHYMTADLHVAARCYALYCNDEIASIGACLFRPHPKVRDIIGLSRLVTLPDYQGLGLAMVLSDQLGALHKSVGYRFHTYPAHPVLIRNYDKSKNYILKTRPGFVGRSSSRSSGANVGDGSWRAGSRPCAAFEYCGPAMEDKQEAAKILGWSGSGHF